MAISPLTMASIGNLDRGAVAIAVDLELQKIFADLDDRPDLIKKRELAIKLTFSPDEKMQDGESAVVEVEISSKVPGKTTSSRLSMNRRTSQFSFSSHSPSNPRQPALPGYEDGED